MRSFALLPLGLLLHACFGFVPRAFLQRNPGECRSAEGMILSGVSQPHANSLFNCGIAVTAERRQSRRRTSVTCAAATVEVTLSKPMGLIFEANDAATGGIYVMEIADGGNAAALGTIDCGDVLLSVDGKSAAGLDFDSAMQILIDAPESDVTLAFSREVTAVAKAAADVPPTKPKSAVKRPSFQTKLVKTATNPVTWKNGLYAGSLAIAVALPLGLLLLAQK